LFFSLLYLLALGAILVLTTLSIRAFLQGKPVIPLLVGMTGIAVFYLLLTALSVWTE
jgi:hypothetical protein